MSILEQKKSKYLSQTSYLLEASYYVTTYKVENE